MCLMIDLDDPLTGQVTKSMKIQTIDRHRHLHFYFYDEIHTECLSKCFHTTAPHSGVSNNASGKRAVASSQGKEEEEFHFRE